MQETTTEITFEGTLTKEEFLAVVKLSSQPVGGKPFALRVSLWQMFVTAGAFLLIGGIAQMPRALATCVVWLVPGLLLLVLGLKLRAAPRKLWAQTAAFRDRRSGVVTETGIEVATSSAQVRLLWRNLVGYWEYEGMVVLFDGVAAIPFPKRSFRSSLEWEAFRAQTAARLPVSHRVTPLYSEIVLAMIVAWLALLAFVLGRAGPTGP
jgi:hypothetical protein